MHEQEIINQLLERLDTKECTIKIISLLCREKQLVDRLKKDVCLGLRTAEVIKRSVERIPLYGKLQTEKIDTSEITVEQTADIILKL